MKIIKKALLFKTLAFSTFTYSLDAPNYVIHDINSDSPFYTAIEIHGIGRLEYASHGRKDDANDGFSKYYNIYGKINDQIVSTTEMNYKSTGYHLKLCAVLNESDISKKLIKLIFMNQNSKNK